MNEEEIERSSLLDLATVVREARKLGIRLLLIGGYAVSAYTRGYRYTKDIDLVIDKPAIGKLKGLLASLGYSVRDTEFGLAGSKRLDGGFIDMHVGVGKVHDISTKMDYQFDSMMFKNAERLKIKGYYLKTQPLRVPVVELETLFVLKMMPVGRQKDSVDILSLLLDKRSQIDLKLLAKRAKDADLTMHILNQARDYARKLREGGLDRFWFDMTASRLPHVEKMEILRFFGKLANLLRQP